MSSFIALAEEGLAELGERDPERDLDLYEVLSEEELVAIEKRLGILLPEDYRSYLALLGNGGAGPHHGIMSFEGGDEDDLTDYELLKEPFAFETSGALWICHDGGGRRFLLVITGPSRGEIWIDAAEDDAAFKPCLDASGKRHTFASWYLAWLAAELDA